MNKDKAKEQLEEYLKSHNYRVTKERFEVLNAAMNYNGHFEADELFAILKSKKSKVSRATIYNTLEVLVNCGLIFKHRFNDNLSRYEKAFGRSRHDHLICLGCGDIIEFVFPQIEVIQKDICKKQNFVPQNSTFQIFGYCKKCQK